MNSIPLICARISRKRAGIFALPNYRKYITFTARITADVFFQKADLPYLSPKLQKTTIFDYISVNWWSFFIFIKKLPYTT